MCISATLNSVLFFSLSRLDKESATSDALEKTDIQQSLMSAENDAGKTQRCWFCFQAVSLRKTAFDFGGS